MEVIPLIGVAHAQCAMCRTLFQAPVAAGHAGSSTKEHARRILVSSQGITDILRGSARVWLLVGRQDWLAAVHGALPGCCGTGVAGATKEKKRLR